MWICLWLAAQKTYLQIGKAQRKKTEVAFAPIVVESKEPIAIDLTKVIEKTIHNDFEFTNFFNFVKQTLFPKKIGITPMEMVYEAWKSSAAEIIITGSLQYASQKVTLEFYSYDLKGKKNIFSKRYIGKKEDIKDIAHAFSNDFYEKVTGQKGIFNTKIAMACKNNGKKEIYVMDFDGSQVRQITQHHSIAFSPAWSPDSAKLAYSLFNRHSNGQKNIDLFEFNFYTQKNVLLSNRKGINSGAFYLTPETLLLTMSFLGNPEIFLLHSTQKTVERLTHTGAMNVDPSASLDQKNLAFVSSQSGRPMIYTQALRGTSPKRLTFAGRYNATPAWSPSGDKILFSGWKDKNFDIFIMNSDGTHIERLTKNEGSNEDPVFSPDGNFIAFTSDRNGQKNIYTMHSDGNHPRRLTFGLGECDTPKWSYRF